MRSTAARYRSPPTPPIQYADTDSGHWPMIARTGRYDAPVLIAAAAAADDDGGEPTNAILTRLMSRQTQTQSLFSATVELFEQHGVERDPTGELSSLIISP